VEVYNRFTLCWRACTRLELVIAIIMIFILVWCVVVKDVYEQHGKIILPLTSGYDSRLTLSICINSGVPFETFTFQYRYIDNNHPDILIPKQLAEITGVKHQVLTLDPPNQVDTVLTKQFGDDFALLESSVIEIIKNHYGNIIPYNTFMLSKRDSFPRDKQVETELANVLNEIESLSRNYGIPARDLYYWESRMSKWCSVGYNKPSTYSKVNIYNYGKLLKTLIMVNPDSRKLGKYLIHRDFIEIACPQISQIPYNPTNLLGRLRNYLKRNKYTYSLGTFLFR